VSSEPLPGPLFDALGDPTRRQIITLLSSDGPATATALSRRLPISRQAVAKHLDQLRAAGFTAVRRSGREARHELVPERLDEAGDWLAEQARAWDARMERIRRELNRRDADGGSRR
jgi:ArsR family transcriptional regulator, cadmium/lead-responsive transcriptional repressor